MAPAVANDFVQVLASQTRPLPTLPGMDTDIPVNTAAESEPEVRTYGIGHELIENRGASIRDHTCEWLKKGIRKILTGNVCAS